MAVLVSGCNEEIKREVSMQVAAEKMAAYLATARQRWIQKQHQLTQHQLRAWKVARQAEALLHERFKVNRVVVFGSLVRSDLFHPRSDVDLAVWGLDEKEYYRAVAQLLALDPTIEIDLVMAEDAPASLLANIEKEGVAL